MLSGYVSNLTLAIIEEIDPGFYFFLGLPWSKSGVDPSDVDLIL